MKRLIQRGLNSARRVRCGLPLHAENVSPEVPNDLFQAHLSIYWFFARFVEGRRVLDLGSGSVPGCQPEDRLSQVEPVRLAVG
jgi:hypothetical protein